MQRAYDLPAGLGAQGRVEGGERLVEQDHRGLRGERAGQRDPLLLPAGQLVRVSRRQGGRQLDQLEHLAQPVAAATRTGQPEGDVVPDGEVGEQRTLLRHVADPALLRRHRAAGTHHGALAEHHHSLVRLHEAGDDPEQRGLAASRRAQNGRDRPMRDVQVQLTQDRPAAEADAESARGHRRHDALDLLDARVSSNVAGTETSTMSSAYGAAAP
jgi:hypothetical protein